MAKFIEQEFNIIYGPGIPYKEEYNINTIYSICEEAGRTCYKSIGCEPEKFINSLLKNNHTSVLEHGPIYYTESKNLREIIENEYNDIYITLFELESSKISNPITIISYILEKKIKLLSSWQEIDNTIPLEEQYMSVRFIIDRAIANELVRHRKMSFSQESTRYCNYTKDKFGGITFIIPSNIKDIESFKDYCNMCEAKYNALIQQGYKAEDTRAVLPLCTKTELVMTGKVKDWIWVFMNRAFNIVGKAHPQLREVMLALCNKILPIWIKRYGIETIKKLFIFKNKCISQQDIKNNIYIYLEHISNSKSSV